MERLKSDQVLRALAALAQSLRDNPIGAAALLGITAMVCSTVVAAMALQHSSGREPSAPPAPKRPNAGYAAGQADRQANPAQPPAVFSRGPWHHMDGGIHEDEANQQREDDGEQHQEELLHRKASFAGQLK